MKKRSVFLRSLRTLSPEDSGRISRLLALAVITALVEVAGVGSIAPFVAMLTQPEHALANPYLERLNNLLGFTDFSQMLVFLGTSVVLITLLRNTLFALKEWFFAHYLALIKHNLSSELLMHYLRQPYPYFLTRNTQELQRNVAEETRIVVDGVLRPSITAIAQLCTSVAIIGLLILVNPFVALVTLVVLGMLYLSIYYFINRRLGDLSTLRKRLRKMRFQLAGEALSGVKALILSGNQQTYADEYRKLSMMNAKAEARGLVFGNIPRFAVESVALVGLILFIVLDTSNTVGGATNLPLIALYLMAGYRLLPALQSLYASVTSIRFENESYKTLQQDLVQGSDTSIERNLPDRLVFEHGLHFTDVSYQYPEASDRALKSMTFTIRPNETVAVVGKTGAGKSTLIDLVLGLIDPTEGEITVDQKPLADCRRAWQRQIGYVPQQVYIADDTVTRNIAFGVPKENIDRKRVTDAATAAGIHDHIANNLEKGYDTLLGERGIRLSGGQCQRLGLARALYDEPGVLVFDEATSALDESTERSIMLAIRALAATHTIILIAHRKSTIDYCERIILIESGQIVEDAATAEMCSSIFRELFG
ncbi:MAG: ABC transporter ATP-binding protein/permease [Woeseia sp.]|nr:ABC transporter ATP-binding protein/permease [Woeseia sp.]